MATADRVRTLVKNLTSRRRVTWVPPNGREMGQDEQISVSGVLETIVALGMDGSVFDQYVYDLENDRVEITKLGYAGGSESQYFTTTLGDGINSTFVVNAGFLTIGARIFLFDAFGGGPIYFFTSEPAVPGPTQVTLTLIPPPALNQILVFIFPV